MFERNRSDTLEHGAIAVEVLLDDGTVSAGRLFIQTSRTLPEVLNGALQYLEFEPYEGERRYIAKSAIKALKQLAQGKLQSLAQRARDMDGFDPYAVLGVSQDVAWDEVRSAYLARAKIYHPDRFAGVEMPPEVDSYLSAMARRINSAYAALELKETSRKAPVSRPQTMIYSSAMRGQKPASFNSST